MKFRRLYIVLGMALLVAIASSGRIASSVVGGLAGTQEKAAVDASGHPLATPPFPDAYKLNQGPRSVSVPGVITSSTNGLTHPCSGMSPQPPFTGLSPIAIVYPYANCQGTPDAGGDIATWQNSGHSFVGLSGFGGLSGTGKMFWIFNVDDPYNPVIIAVQSFPTGGTASLSIFDWPQNGHQYMSVMMRGSGTGCGFFVYNVDDAASPQFVARKTGADWCTVHEHFVSLDANGNADYAWLAMSGEYQSGIKIVALDIRDLSNMVEVNRYQRTGSNVFVHDSNVVRGKVYVADWAGGLQIFDKSAFVSGGTPVPLNPVDSIRPSSFWIHHVVPTTDDRYVFIQDEFINSPSLGKVKMYDISDLSNPHFVADIVGGDAVANSSQAHNMIIKPLSTGVDLLLDAWYKAGIRGNLVNTTPATPTITQVFSHQLAQTAGAGFGNVWGVDWLPCTLRGLQRTCLYSGDMKFGLVVDAVNTDTFQPDPSLDPYNPDPPVISDPVNGQQINTCTYNISGTAQDYWSGIQTVRVSTDGGTNWNDAQGTTNWSYNWNIPAPGQYNILVQASDMANNITASGIITVDVTASCPFTTPTVILTHTPTSTSMPTFTPTSTATQQDTATFTATNTATVTSSGTPTSTATSIVTETPTSIVTETPTVCTMSFSDVTPGDWFYPYVRCLYCQGIIVGYPDGTFRPNNELTRGQLAKIVSMSAGYNGTVTGQSFEDVPMDSTFWVYIERLYMHNVVSGYACGGPGEPCGPSSLPYYRPASTTTRGQVAKTVVVAGGMPINIAGGPHFTDVPTDQTFYNYIETLYNAGVVTGYADGTFRPENNVTRAQLAKMIVLVFFPECVQQQ
jgi:S-layer homology domain